MSNYTINLATISNSIDQNNVVTSCFVIAKLVKFKNKTK